MNSKGETLKLSGYGSYKHYIEGVLPIKGKEKGTWVFRRETDQILNVDLVWKGTSLWPGWVDTSKVL